MGMTGEKRSDIAIAVNIVKGNVQFFDSCFDLIRGKIQVPIAAIPGVKQVTCHHETVILPHQGCYCQPGIEAAVQIRSYK